MTVTSHDQKPAPEARAPSRQEQAARYAPYQALIEKIEELDAYSHQVMHQWPKIERHVLAAYTRSWQRKAAVDAAETVEEVEAA